MKILSIETSCDETAISLLEATETESGTSFTVHGDITSTQIATHAKFGGVFPGMAKREHMINLPILLDSIMEGQDIPDVICVTSGPGLEPALWCGIVFAKTLGEKWNIPVVPVNHMEGHILSVIVPQSGGVNFQYKEGEILFPALALLISGGHTELVLAKAIGDYEIVGKTRDDAVGEAFDKVARILGIPYPGGPSVSNLAKLAREYEHTQPLLYRGEKLELPRPMIHSKDFDFSFSGIKTAVLYLAKDRNTNPRITEASDLTEEEKMAIARAFEDAVADVLVHKTKKAIDAFGAQTLIIGGGVSANSYIKWQMKTMIDKEFGDMSFLAPERELTGDNALMIALAGYFKIKKDPTRVYEDIKAEGNLSL